MAEEPADTPRPLAEISHGPSAFETFLEKNQKGLIAVGIAVFAATAGWIVVRGVKDAAEKSAGGALVGAEDVAALRTITKDQPGTRAAGSAELLISEKQWDAGEQDAAIETLRGFISSQPDHPAIPSARASLATRLKQQGKLDEASTIFQEVADDEKSRFLAPYALISLGEIHQVAGRIDDAEKAYKRAKEDFGPTNPFSSSADEHLALLRFVAPEEIEAPPAPEPPTGGEILPLPEGADLPPELKGPLADILTGNNATPGAVEAPGDESPAEDEQEAPAEAPEPPAPEEAPQDPPSDGDSN